LTQYDAAATEFQALVARDDKDVGAMIQLANAEKMRGQLAAATEWLEKACEIDGESSVVRLFLGEILYNRGLNSEALAALQRSIELSPDHAEAHHLIAFVLGDLGRHEEARAAAKQAIALNPTYGEAQVNLSLERLAGRRESASFEVLDDAAVKHGEGAVAHHNLGLAFRQQGYYQEALREYRLGLEAGESRELLRNSIAEVYLTQGDLEAALELYQELVVEDPTSPKLWNEHGVVLHLSGRSVAAVESFRRALSQQSNYALASNNQAVALAQSGRSKEAIRHFGDALRSDPSLVVARLNLGLLLFKLRRYQRAMDVPPAWWVMADCGVRSGIAH